MTTTDVTDMDEMPDREIRELADDCVHFAQRLIQTPSMPGEEEAIARLIADEMRDIGLDEVWMDDVGNVYGRLRGQDRSLPALVLNTHLDHVDPGDPDLWPSPPYAGEIVDGRIVGRGASDIKGPLAVQVYSMAGLARRGVRPRRDVVFTGVVEEEIGGSGAIYWAANVDYEVGLVVLGEPSSNEIALGHRGLLAMWVTFSGRSVHASVPEKGDNPNYVLAEFLQRLQTEKARLSAHPLLGQTTVAPTIIEVDTTSTNVTPAWTRVLLDFRTASESSRSLRAFVQQVAGKASFSISPAFEEMPVDDSEETITGFYTAPESELVQRAREAIAHGMGREPAFTRYDFATDGRHFVPYDMPIIGYSPGEEAQAHIAGESISIEMMADSLRGHLALLRHF